MKILLATVLATVIALLAAAIAFGQWWTARQKLVLDLFEKRFQVYLDVRRIASEATPTPSQAINVMLGATVSG